MLNAKMHCILQKIFMSSAKSKPLTFMWIVESQSHQKMCQRWLHYSGKLEPTPWKLSWKLLRGQFSSSIYVFSLHPHNNTLKGAFRGNTPSSIYASNGLVMDKSFMLEPIEEGRTLKHVSTFSYTHSKLIIVIHRFG